MGRAPCCDKANVKRGPWSPEEDATLKDYLQKHGTGGNWIALPHKAGLKRCGKSCRLRWLNYLRPDIKHGGFTEEEDNIICTLYRNIGSRWSVIASKLQGRTDNDVKNYWNTKLKKRVMGQMGQTNTTSYNTTTTTSTYINPSPVLPQILPVKVEPLGFGALPVTPESGFFNHPLADFSPNSNTYVFSPPPMRHVSATSSSFTVENFGCMPWPDVTGVNGGDGHDGMMMDLSYEELLNWCNFHDKGGGEGASTSHSSNNISNHSTSSNVWTNAESKPSQELYQSLTYL